MRIHFKILFDSVNIMSNTHTHTQPTLNLSHQINTYKMMGKLQTLLLMYPKAKGKSVATDDENTALTNVE